MSTASFDLILLWKPEPVSDSDYSALENLFSAAFPNQFNVHAYQTATQAIKHFQSRTQSSPPLIVITKLGKDAESSGEVLVKTIRDDNKSTFIILHSHKACADADLR